MRYNLYIEAPEIDGVSGVYSNGDSFHSPPQEIPTPDQFMIRLAAWQRFKGCGASTLCAFAAVFGLVPVTMMESMYKPFDLPTEPSLMSWCVGTNAFHAVLFYPDNTPAISMSTEEFMDKVESVAAFIDSNANLQIPGSLAEAEKRTLRNRHKRHNRANNRRQREKACADKAAKEEIAPAEEEVEKFWPPRDDSQDPEITVTCSGESYKRIPKQKKWRQLTSDIEYVPSDKCSTNLYIPESTPFIHGVTVNLRDYIPAILAKKSALHVSPDNYCTCAILFSNLVVNAPMMRSEADEMVASLQSISLMWRDRFASMATRKMVTCGKRQPTISITGKQTIPLVSKNNLSEAEVVSSHAILPATVGKLGKPYEQTRFSTPGQLNPSMRSFIPGAVASLQNVGAPITPEDLVPAYNSGSSHVFIRSLNDKSKATTYNMDSERLRTELYGTQANTTILDLGSKIEPFVSNAKHLMTRAKYSEAIRTVCSNIYADPEARLRNDAKILLAAKTDGVTVQPVLEPECKLVYDSEKYDILKNKLDVVIAKIQHEILRYDTPRVGVVHPNAKPSPAAIAGTAQSIAPMLSAYRRRMRQLQPGWNIPADDLLLREFSARTHDHFLSVMTDVFHQLADGMTLSAYGLSCLLDESTADAGNDAELANIHAHLVHHTLLIAPSQIGATLTQSHADAFNSCLSFRRDTVAAILNKEHTGTPANSLIALIEDLNLANNDRPAPADLVRRLPNVTRTALRRIMAENGWSRRMIGRARDAIESAVADEIQARKYHLIDLGTEAQDNGNEMQERPAATPEVRPEPLTADQPALPQRLPVVAGEARSEGEASDSEGESDGEVQPNPPAPVEEPQVQQPQIAQQVGLIIAAALEQRARAANEPDMEIPDDISRVSRAPSDGFPSTWAVGMVRNFLRRAYREVAELEATAPLVARGRLEANMNTSEEVDHQIMLPNSLDQSLSRSWNAEPRITPESGDAFELAQQMIEQIASEAASLDAEEIAQQVYDVVERQMRQNNMMDDMSLPITLDASAESDERDAAPQGWFGRVRNAFADEHAEADLREVLHERMIQHMADPEVPVQINPAHEARNGEVVERAGHGIPNHRPHFVPAPPPILGGLDAVRIEPAGEARDGEIVERAGPGIVDRRPLYIPPPPPIRGGVFVEERGNERAPRRAQPNRDNTTEYVQNLSARIAASFVSAELYRVTEASIAARVDRYTSVPNSPDTVEMNRYEIAEFGREQNRALNHVTNRCTIWKRVVISVRNRVAARLRDERIDPQIARDYNQWALPLSDIRRLVNTTSPERSFTLDDRLEVLYSDACPNLTPTLHTDIFHNPTATQIASFEIARIFASTTCTHETIKSTITRRYVDEDNAIVKDEDAFEDLAETRAIYKADTERRLRITWNEAHAFVSSEMQKSVLRVLSLVAIRPLDAVSYDKFYWRVNNKWGITEERRNVQEYTAPSLDAPYFQLTTIRAMRFEDVYPTGSHYHYTAWMNDVHYYLLKLNVARFPNTVANVTGMNYTMFQPADYTYPFGNGSYSIVPVDHPNDPALAYPQIRVTTSGTGSNGDYEHPVVLITNPTTTWDFPWFSCVTYLGPMDGLRLATPVIPNTRFPSPQTEFFDNRATISSLFVVTKKSANASSSYTDKANQVIRELMHITSVDQVPHRAQAVAGILRDQTPELLSFQKKHRFGTHYLTKALTFLTASVDKHVVCTRTDAIPHHLLPSPIDLGGWATIRRSYASTATRVHLDDYSSTLIRFGMRNGKKIRPAQAFYYLKVQPEKVATLIDPSTALEQAISKEFLQAAVLNKNKEAPALKASSAPWAPVGIEQSVAIPYAPTIPQNASMTRTSTYYFAVKPVDVSQLRLNITTMKESINAHMLEHVRQTPYQNPPLLRSEQRESIGYDAYSTKGPIINFEMDSTNYVNFLSAFYVRHLGPMVKPDQSVVSDFREWARPYINDICQAMYDLGDIDPLEVGTLQEHYASKGWPSSKQGLYVSECLRQLKATNPRDFLITYTLLVKSGEVYTSDCARFVNGFIYDVSERPRLIWNPSRAGKGLSNYLQSYVFPRLRKVYPDFIHAMNSKSLKKVVLEKTSKFVDPVSISLDGSAFDSTQYAELQDIVDRHFLYNMIPLFERALKILTSRHHPHLHCDPRQLATWAVEAAVDTKATAFAIIPELAATGWILPKKYWDAARYTLGAEIGYRPKEIDPRTVFVTIVNGTTYSGNPVKTTLGNSLRASLYYHFFLRHIKHELIVSGDDVVIWVERSDSGLAADTIRKNSATNTNLQTIGLGQIVKDIVIREALDFDFCSKMCFSTPKSGFVMLRDVKKALTTKLTYDPKSGLSVSDYMHALRLSVCYELPSPWIHSMMEKRMRQVCSDAEVERQALEKFQTHYKNKPFFNDEHYQTMCYDQELQQQIFARAGIDMATYYGWMAGMDHRIVFGARRMLLDLITTMKKSVKISEQPPLLQTGKRATTPRRSTSKRAASGKRTPSTRATRRPSVKNLIIETPKTPHRNKPAPKAKAPRINKAHAHEKRKGHHGGMRGDGPDAYVIDNWASALDEEMFRASTTNPGVVPCLPVFDGHTPNCAPYVAGANYIPTSNTQFIQEWQIIMWAPVLCSSTPAASGSGLRVFDIPTPTLNLNANDLFFCLPFPAVWTSSPAVWSDGLRVTSSRLTIKPEVTAAQACGTVYWNTCTLKQLKAGITLAAILAGAASTPYKAGQHYSISTAVSNPAFLLNETVNTPNDWELAEDERIGFMAFHNISRPLQTNVAIAAWTWTASMAMNYVVFPFYDDTLLQHMTDKKRSSSKDTVSTIPDSLMKAIGKGKAGLRDIVVDVATKKFSEYLESSSAGSRDFFDGANNSTWDRAAQTRRAHSSFRKPKMSLDHGLSKRPTAKGEVHPINPGMYGGETKNGWTKNAGKEFALVEGIEGMKWTALGLAAGGVLGAFGGVPGKVFKTPDDAVPVQDVFYPDVLKSDCIFIGRSLDDMQPYYKPGDVGELYANLVAAFGLYQDSLQASISEQELARDAAARKSAEQRAHDDLVERRCKDLLYAKLLDEQRGEGHTVKAYHGDDFVILKQTDFKAI